MKDSAAVGLDMIPLAFGLFPNVSYCTNGKLHTLNNDRVELSRVSTWALRALFSPFVVYKRLVQLSGKLVLEEAAQTSPLLVLVIAMYHYLMEVSLREDGGRVKSGGKSQKSGGKSQKGGEKRKENGGKSQKNEEELQKENEKPQEGGKSQMKEGNVVINSTPYTILYPLSRK